MMKKYTFTADGNFTAGSEFWSTTQVLGVIEQFGLVRISSLRAAT